MGNSLTVNGKEVATEEYVDNKVSEAMAYQTSVSSISNDNASNDESVSAEQPIRAASNQPSNAITLDPNDSNLSKKDQIKEEVIKSNKDSDKHRTYDGGNATMVDNTDISDEGTAIDASVSVPIKTKNGRTSDREIQHQRVTPIPAHTVMRARLISKSKS